MNALRISDGRRGWLDTRLSSGASGTDSNYTYDTGANGIDRLTYGARPIQLSLKRALLGGMQAI